MGTERGEKFIVTDATASSSSLEKWCALRALRFVQAIVISSDK
jgi:hypothetical protein